MPHLTIGARFEQQGVIRFLPVNVHGGSATISTQIVETDLMVRLRQAPEEAHRDLLVAAAHSALDHDLLVTTSTFLLSDDGRRISGANAVSPEEAAKVVGLFLRSRDDYSYSSAGFVTFKSNRSRFYQTLARHRLPALWRYTDACVQSDKHRRDESTELASSIMVRLSCILQQRDAIAFEFYKEHPDAGAMMSSLEYWSLLAMGILDAMARVAFRAYQGLRDDETRVNFGHTGFIRQIEKHGGTKLAATLRTEHVDAFIDLVQALRNMIHGASYTQVTIVDRATRASRLRVPNREASAVYRSSERLRSPHELGIERSYGVLVEPFTFVWRMTELLFRIINEIAEATDVERLFPTSVSAEPLPSGPPDDERQFDRLAAPRFAALA